MLCSVSSARVYSPRPVGGGLVENSDGTWSLWGEGTDKPLRTYTSDAKYRMMQEDAALRLEVGTTGQDLKVVEGLTKAQEAQVQELASKLRTGDVYGTLPEAQLGSEVVAEAEASSTLPAWGEVVATAGAGASAVVWGAGAAYMGVQIGNSIDRLVGLPELSLSKIFGGEAPNPNCGGVHGPFCEDFVEQEHWEPRKRINTHAESCGALLGKYGYEEFQGFQPSSGDICIQIASPHVYKSVQHYSGGKVQEVEETHWLGQYGENPKKVLQYCYPSEHLKGGFCAVEYYDENRGREQVNVWDLTRSKDGPHECKPPLHGICYQRGAAFEPAFPTTGLESTGGPEGSPGSLSPLAPVPTPVKPSKAPEVSPKVVTYIIYEHPEEFPEAPPETEEEEKEQEKPIPSPLWPTLPSPEPNEVGTDYKSRVETDGFTNVEIQVLPDSRVDPRVGPGEVSKVDPKPGNPYDPSTKVTIVVNPETGVPPGGETGKIPPVNIGGVDEPELKPPHLNVLCENFPFGVPCWLVEQFNSWSATGHAPTLGIDSFTIKGHKIDAGSVNLESLEPVMTKVRPFMIIFGTIGLVLLFYGFATGGNPGAGSGSSGGGSGSDDRESEE